MKLVWNNSFGRISFERFPSNIYSPSFRILFLPLIFGSRFLFVSVRWTDRGNLLHPVPCRRRWSFRFIAASVIDIAHRSRYPSRLGGVWESVVHFPIPFLLSFSSVSELGFFVASSNRCSFNFVSTGLWMVSGLTHINITHICILICILWLISHTFYPNFLQQSQKISDSNLVFFTCYNFFPSLSLPSVSFGSTNFTS